MQLQTVKRLSISRINVSGGFIIQGTTQKLNQAYKDCIVLLLDRASNQVIDRVQPQSDGKYSFSNLKKTTFSVIAFDNKQQYNAVIQDNVIPK